MRNETAIYTDGVHLVCSDLETLHRFAASIGLRRSWFQDDGGPFPHYDLTTKRMRQKALRAGARLVSTRETLMLLRGSEKYRAWRRGELAAVMRRRRNE